MKLKSQTRKEKLKNDQKESASSSTRRKLPKITADKKKENSDVVLRKQKKTEKAEIRRDPNAYLEEHDRGLNINFTPGILYKGIRASNPPPGSKKNKLTRKKGDIMWPIPLMEQPNPIRLRQRRKHDGVPMIPGGGIYAITPFATLDKHRKGLFKIGYAQNFAQRLDSYHTYFPLGFYSVAFLIEPPLYDERATREETKEIVDTTGWGRRTRRGIAIHDYLEKNPKKKSNFAPDPDHPEVIKPRDENLSPSAAVALAEKILPEKLILRNPNAPVVRIADPDASVPPDARVIVDNGREEYFLDDVPTAEKDAQEDEEELGYRPHKKKDLPDFRFGHNLRQRDLAANGIIISDRQYRMLVRADIDNRRGVFKKIEQWIHDQIQNPPSVPALKAIAEKDKIRTFGERIRTTTRIKGFSEWFYTNPAYIELVFEAARTLFGGVTQFFSLSKVNARFIRDYVQPIPHHMATILYHVKTGPKPPFPPESSSPSPAADSPSSPPSPRRKRKKAKKNNTRKK